VFQGTFVNAIVSVELRQAFADELITTGKTCCVDDLDYEYATSGLVAGQLTSEATASPCVEVKSH